MRAGDAVQGGGGRWGERAAAHVAVVSRSADVQRRASAFQSACVWFVGLGLVSFHPSPSLRQFPQVQPRYRKYTLPCSTATIKPPRVNATSGGATEFSQHPFIPAHRPPPSTGDHCKRITVCVRLSIYIFSKVVGSTHEHSASMLSTSHGPNLEAHTPNTITSPPHASRSLSTRRCRAEGGGRQAILPTPPWGRGARRRGAELRPLLLRSSALQHAAARRRLWDARRALGSRRRL